MAVYLLDTKISIVDIDPLFLFCFNATWKQLPRYLSFNVFCFVSSLFVKASTILTIPNTEGNILP